jgi:hypothetical protein
MSGALALPPSLQSSPPSADASRKRKRDDHDQDHDEAHAAPKGQTPSPKRQQVDSPQPHTPASRCEWCHRDIGGADAAVARVVAPLTAEALSSLSANESSTESDADSEAMADGADVVPRQRSVSRSRRSRGSAGSEASVPAISPATYRTSILSDARCRFHFSLRRDAPAAVRSRIGDILQRDLGADRVAVLRELADTATKSMNEVVQSGAAGEDDCIEPVQALLKALRRGRDVEACQKDDWREELKPVPRPRIFFAPPGALLSTALAAVPHPARASKRHQQQPPGDITPSPDPSLAGDATDATDATPDPPHEALMPPPPRPAPQPSSSSSQVKTPRPDITIGLAPKIVVGRLVKADIPPVCNETRAHDFLRDLASGGLSLQPTKRDENLIASFLVLEGKGYATLGNVYGAQNQAGVSGASSLKMLLDLARSAHACRKDGNGADDDEAPYRVTPENTPIVFTLCTHGYSIELWAHYATWKDEVLFFDMALVDAWVGTLDEQMERFVMTLERVIRWGIGGHLDRVVRDLLAVASYVT